MVPPDGRGSLPLVDHWTLPLPLSKCWSPAPRPSRHHLPLTLIHAPPSTAAATTTVATTATATATVAGLRRLREMWPEEEVDAQALADSDPVQLALAVRALSDRLPEVY